MEYGCRIMRYYYDYYRHRDHPQHQDCYNHQECYDYRYVRSTYYVLPPRWMICSLVQSPVRQQGPGLWASGGMSVLGRIRASDRRAILYYRYYRRTPRIYVRSSYGVYSWTQKEYRGINTPYVRRSSLADYHDYHQTEFSPRIRIRRGLTSVFLVGREGGQLGSSSTMSIPRAWMG